MDDMLVKSLDEKKHLDDLQETFDTLSVGKSGFISQTKHSGSNKHGSISFMIDNMHYVIFRI